MKRINVFLITVALIIGTVGCASVQYELTISCTEGGEVVTPSEASSSYDEGTVVSLVAFQHTGYRFVNWTGDVGTIADVNDATTSITMNGDYTIIANFEEIPTTETPTAEELLGIRYVAAGYTLQQFMPSAFGLSAQLALLPDGDIAMSDYNQRIHILSGGIVRVLAVQDNFKPAIAALADGYICCARLDGQLVLFHPQTGNMKDLGNTSPDDSPSALASDNAGDVYAATAKRNLYRFDSSGNRTTVVTNLPFEDIGYSITDMDIAPDGTIYITGYNRAVAVKPDGKVAIITDDLHDEPTWCEIAPDGKVYIKDIPSGVRSYDPATGTLTQVKIDGDTGVSDFLALSNDEFLFIAMGVDLVYSYNIVERTARAILVNAVNSFAFAANADNAVFLAAPGMEPHLKSYMVRVNADGTRKDLTELAYARIQAANVDQSDRLCLATDQGFCRLEKDGTITSFPLKGELTSFFPERPGDFAVGPDGKWYCISTDYNDSISVYCFNEQNNVVFLPITFNRASFGDAFQVADARIDVSSDGRLVLIVTAIGTKGQGPYYQRVYCANADGTNLTQIAKLDADRVGGMVDISVGPTNDVFVLTVQKSSEIIYRIDQSNTVSEFLVMATGRDPKSIDVDPHGNVWFCTTVGVFLAKH